MAVAAAALLGAVMLTWPRPFWRLTEGWRYDDPEGVQLDAAYLALNAVNGAVVIGFGVVLLAWAYAALPLPW